MPLRSTDVTTGSSGGAGTFTSIVNTGLTDLSAAGAGQIKFPVTENSSADPNTLDDYEEGTWTPVLTFVAPGDLAVTYTTQTGQYTKVGNLVTLNCIILTSSFTFTTATGGLRVTGIPYSAVTGSATRGALLWGGITKASYTQICAQVGLATAISFSASGSGQPVAAVSSPDTPTGGTMQIQFTIQYFTAT